MRKWIMAPALALIVACGLTAQSTQPKAAVLVAGGSFAMGFESALVNAERPVHKVSLASFYMSSTEVTFGEFGEFAASSGYKTSCERDGQGSYILANNNDIFVRKPEMTWRHSSFAQGPEQPVVSVSWIDAVNYANWLSQRDGLQPAYKISGDMAVWDRQANGWRLPTEAEWEYAARGGRESRAFHYAGSDNFYQVSWNSENALQTTHPVATKQANELGLYDMTGNVYEWCWDWYGSYGAEDQINPVGPDSGVFHVLRGGSWNSGPSATTEPITTTFRQFDQAFRAFNTYGFRLVRSAPQS